MYKIQRVGKVNRMTSETKVSVKLNLDGQWQYKINTTIPFLDHMLEQFSKHSGFDLKIEAMGDTKIDDHHLVEDIGIALGEAMSKALKDKAGIARYGHNILKQSKPQAEVIVPMDEALSYVAVDISGRPHLTYNARFKDSGTRFDLGLFEDFFQALVNNAAITLHINIIRGRNEHHKAEAVFKAFGRALAMAVARTRGRRSVPSTKGRL